MITILQSLHAFIFLQHSPIVLLSHQAKNISNMMREGLFKLFPFNTRANVKRNTRSKR